MLIRRAETIERILSLITAFDAFSRAIPFEPSLRLHVAENLARFVREPLPASDLRKAAVSIVLLPDTSGAACFVLTRRAAHLGRHGGQFALPGGRLDPGEDAVSAAIRELREEVGVAVPANAVLGVLDDYPTRSGYAITPVVVWCDGSAPLSVNPEEVAEAYIIPIGELNGPDIPVLRAIPESDRPVLSLPLLGSLVHSPTAAVLYQLREVALHGKATRVAHFEQPVFAWR